jgi:hypothetical protein
MKFRKLMLIFAIALFGSAVVTDLALAQRPGGRPGGPPPGGHGYSGGHSHARVGVGVYFGPGWWGPGPYWGPYWGGYWGSGYWGSPYWGSPYWGAPYYYPPVVVQQAPQTYVERDPAPATPAPPQQTQQWWYYCPGANAYYPYVKECPGGWQRVSPQPPS